MKRYLFDADELASLKCPRCGRAVVASAPFLNNNGDLVQFAYCPRHKLNDHELGYYLPRSIHISSKDL